MNILQITSDWKWTGPAEPMLLVLEALRFRGHQVSLVCPEAAEAREAGLAAMARQRGVANRLELMRARGARWWRDSGDASRLSAFIAEAAIDIVHTWHTRDHVLAWRAVRGQRPGGRTVVVRSLAAAERLSGAPWNRLLFGSGCDGLLCAGERAVEQNTRLRAGRPISAWLGAVSLERFAPGMHEPEDLRSLRRSLGLGDPSPGGVIGVVARVQRHRRFDLLLRAMKELVATHPGARLLVVGRGTHLESVARRPAAELGLRDHVVFAGYRRQDYAAVLAVIDVLTFLVPGSDGTCRAVLEAAASGIPCVATRRGILPEIVLHGETGVIVEEDPAALAAVWRRLLDDSEERRRLGEAARRRAETAFASECAAERVEQLYAAALTGRATHRS